MTAHTEPYLPKLKDQIAYLNSRTAFIWICGVLFTRLATGTWLGDRPVFVLMVLLTLVYLYMHIGYYVTMLIRFPLVLLLLYLGHTHLVQPGDFLMAMPISLSWKHLLLMWGAMNFSFVFRGETYPFKWGTVHWMAAAGNSNPADGSKGDKVFRKVVPLRRHHATPH